ncbi:N/A [soil metagenome]
MKVLVGEDDVAIAEVVGIILESNGHEVIHADDEKTFTSSLSQSPDLILLDVALGGSNGGDITKKVKKDPNHSSIPLIIVSANSDTEKIASTSGADGFLLKPFEMEDLLTLVDTYKK